MSTKSHPKCPQKVTQKCPRKVNQKEDFSWTLLSTRCHQKCPRDVTHFVHEKSPIMSTRCLPPILLPLYSGRATDHRLRDTNLERALKEEKYVRQSKRQKNSYWVKLGTAHLYILAAPRWCALLVRRCCCCEEAKMRIDRKKWKNGPFGSKNRISIEAKVWSHACCIIIIIFWTAY